MIRTIEVSRTDYNKSYDYKAEKGTPESHLYTVGPDCLDSHGWREIMDNYLAGKGVPAYISVKDETRFVGACIKTTMHYGVRIMSDVWEDQEFMEVYAPEQVGKKYHEYGAVETEPFHGVYLWGTDGSSNAKRVIATVDASPELVENYNVWVAECARIAEENRVAEARRASQERIEREARTIRVGKTVIVNRGRKVPKNTKGVCFWMGIDNYGKGKIGIATSDRRNERGGYADVQWTAEANCDVVTEH